MKNSSDNLIRIALNLYIVLDCIITLTILILLIQEHGISFHLFLSSLISFIGVLYVLEHSYFDYLGRFIPRYFTLFDVMVNGIVFLTSLSDLSLLAYRNPTKQF